MADYNYKYPSQFSHMLPPDTEYASQGDGMREYYEMGNIKANDSKRAGRSDRRTKTRSRSQSNRSSSQSRSRSRSRSQSRSPRSRSSSHQCNLSLKEPGFLDAFRILYLTPSKHKKSTTKFLATKKRQDQIQETLKRDRLGSKRWLFYPRSQPIDDANVAPVTRETSDQRFKVDANFFRKYKRTRMVDSEAPIMKLKRWELVLYKKLGFIQAV